MNPYLVCGDIGGTKTLLRASVTSNNTSAPYLERYYDSLSYDDFDTILDDFLQDLPAAPKVVCLAIAGPVIDQQVALTNLNWHIGAQHIKSRFSIPAIRIMNDFEAVAYSIEALSTDNLVTLQAGSRQSATASVVLGAGTGMGVAWLVTCANRTTVLATEAGHIDFAPANTFQIALLDYLGLRYGHVSIERILSGQGLVDLFNFLQQYSPESGQTGNKQLVANNAAMVTRLAFEQQHPAALQTLEHFSEIYGAYAGNLALAGLCHSGVYIAGGIAPRILQILQQPGFIRAFQNKGRFSALMQTIPVHVIVNDKAGLLGAELIAHRMLQAAADVNASHQ
ncbi:MAG: glucokinase [Nitrosomonas sp.]|nr:glucokinase [Nitrosomonas sp.]